MAKFLYGASSIIRQHNALASEIAVRTQLCFVRATFLGTLVHFLQVMITYWFFSILVNLLKYIFVELKDSLEMVLSQHQLLTTPKGMVKGKFNCITNYLSSNFMK